MEQGSFKKSITGLWQLARPDSWRIIIRCLTGMLNIAASLLFVWLSKSLVDIASGDSDASLPVYVAALIGVMLVQFGTNLFASYYEGVITVRATSEMRSMVFERVMRSRWDGREAFHSGDMVNRMEEDIQVVVDLICSRFPDIIITLMYLIASSLYLLSLSPGLMWLLVGLMCVAVLCSKLYFKTIRRLTQAIRQKESEVQGFIQENILHRVVALTLSGVGNVLERMSRSQEEVVGLTTRRLRCGLISRGFMSLGFAAGYASAFLWGIFGIRSGAVTFGGMTAFLQLVGRVQTPISNLSRHVPAFIHALTSVDRVLELTGLAQESYGNPSYISGVPGISVDNVTYRYPQQEKRVLDSFSFDFKPGSITAIMGETGAGKSTLMRLILSLLHPENGAISLYNENGDRIPVSADTRCNFMYVPQGNSLMSGTVRQNFLMACPDATDAEMTEALKTAEAGFVLELPDGLDTLCGEEGTGLSEGQSQRIAIARALLHPGSILILDESTSALDSATERAVLANLHSRCRGVRTVLFVSHREAVSEWADIVLRL